ncbi:protein SMG9 [Exaiptasia diaphana]|uniref:Protein SMG9 n=1 Tax=Exaiptasia diaphana TaxID=2652724 RepID=A0A913Y1W3_EXADI|nr:protein SMG9 [Exaiptasia diaphana]KXJ23158.1 Protein SMG9 [Exaiptasia diaphana]
MEDDRGFAGRGEKSRGRGGRRRERGYRDRPPRGKSEGSSQQQAPPIKTPIILTKTTDKTQESPVKLLLKSRDAAPEEKPLPDAPTASTVLPTMKTKPTREEKHPQGSDDRGAIGGPGTISIQSIQRKASTPGVTSGGLPEGLSSGLAQLRINGVEREVSLQSIKMLDENLHWTDSALDVLADQSDFLVVGAIGLQGSGKSTLLSMIAGASPNTEPRSYLFTPQSKQNQEIGLHQTNGLNIAITTERVILLDTQPLLSPSILDHLIHHERNIPSDYSSPENYHEMQSLQIVTFLLTVCHVILVVQDWFTDVNLLRLLRSAEMLKPSSVPHSSSHESSSGSNAADNAEDHYPEVVFVYNKATREDFHPENINAVHNVTSTLFQHSRLKLRSGMSMLGSGILPFNNLLSSCDDVNLHLIPAYEGATNGHYTGNGILPSYKGYPEFELVIQTLRNQVFSTHRHPLTQHNLTEKNWFHYAARSWDTIRKSSLISEYNRLLSS